MNFKQMHWQNEPLILCNVWDVASAKVAKQLGFKAIGTSSAAIAATLGYEDGEQIDFEELLYSVSRIANQCDLPISVDIESGYSRDPEVIVKYLNKLCAIGVVGINIEDSIVKEKRELVNASEFSETITFIKNDLKKRGKGLFLNVRTDAFLLNCPNTIVEAQERANFYERAGADGIFVPGVVNEEDIKTLVETINLPLNVMCMPNLPSFEVLSRHGVKRISMGSFVHDLLTKKLSQQLEQIKRDASFQSLFL